MTGRRGRSRARELRSCSTPAERILWERLRDRQCGGLKFRRQAPLYGYVADFYCPELRLILELDGAIHATPRQADHDANRDGVLAARGLRVLRISNREVEEDLLGVVARIAAWSLTPCPPLPQERERGDAQRDGGAAAKP